MENSKKRTTQNEGMDLENSNNNNSDSSKQKKTGELAEKTIEDHILEEEADPFEDEFMDEEVIVDPNDLSDDEAQEMNTQSGERPSYNIRLTGTAPEEEPTEEEKVKVWRRGKDKLDPDDQLEFDPSAYFMLQRMNVQWPCLSFDTLIDNNGFGRKKFPLGGYFVSGSQAEVGKENRVYVMKADKMGRISQHHSDSESESDDEDDEENNQAVLSFSMFNHPGCVNRVRSMAKGLHADVSKFVATWSEDTNVYIWDVAQHLQHVDDATIKPDQTLPIFTISHKDEGFALDWSPLVKGQLVTGDCTGAIRLTTPNESGWQTQKQAFAHKYSVEDLQWSYTEKTVFASCSVDRTIRIWDTRMATHGCLFQAADCDVNVISWNSKTSHLLASGADDGSFKVWDLRSVKQSKNACDFIGYHQWHDSPITSIEWDPNDDTALAVSSDDFLTIWDLSLEREEDDMPDEEDDIPPQLLFEHMGQTNIKELHWHPQLPGVICSTAEDSINIFKPNIVEN